MLQDLFLFELNFKQKIKCGLHVLVRPEIAENQLVGGRPVNKNTQNNPRRCPVMGITQRNYALLFKIFQYNWIFFFIFLRFKLDQKAENI